MAQIHGTILVQSACGMPPPTIAKCSMWPVFYSPPHILVGVPGFRKFQVDSRYSRWIPVDSKHNISFLEHFNWFGVYLVHLVKCGYALEVI
jgi:hypothetical protein